jgi:SAM-dependent methyltransferase
MSQPRSKTSEDLLLAQRLQEQLTSSWMAQAIYVAAELRIADLLAAGPRTSADLSAETGAHGPSLHRLLRALATINVCRECDDGSFAITPMGGLLGTDAPASLRHWTLWWGAHLWQVWGNLLYSVKTGKSARTLLTGKEGFGHLEQDLEAAEVFNQALVELTRLTAESVVRAYDFSGFKRIMDVGGGYGELLVAILNANPGTSGVLFDLPHAIQGATDRLAAAGLASRCVCVAGDFLESVPPGADAYLLKSVIHDWDHDKSARILSNCCQAMREGARLLLVERMLPDRVDTSAAHQAVVRSDLTMLVALAGQERTEAEFRALVSAAGFRVTRIVPVGMTFSVIEAVPS